MGAGGPAATELAGTSDLGTLRKPMSIVPILVAVVLAVVVAAVLRGRARARPPRIDPTTATEHDVHRLLSAGRKIEAIKAYRELHGVGLKEAKEAVERMQDRG